MKLFKIIASFLLVLGILALLVWTGIKAKNKTCSDISILVHAQNDSQLLTESDILNILKQNHQEWEGKPIKKIEPSLIHKILSQENYIKSVDKVHFLGSKLQIEVTLYDILLEIEPATGKKFLLDTEGVYLPYSPKVNRDVITVSGSIPNTFQNKDRVTPADKELYDLYSVALLIKENPFYAALFHHMSINNKQEIKLIPTIGGVPVLFGDVQDAEHKLKTLKYMYDDVLPYMNNDKYAQLDVRFKNRIVATKTKS
jgi:hypothetical protein